MVADSVTTLMTSLVEVPVILNGQAAVFKTQLLGPTTQTIDENSPNALLEYKFPDELRKVIQESRYWGRIRSHIMFAFSSKYALALYEAVCLRANLRVDYQDFSVREALKNAGTMPAHSARVSYRLSSRNVWPFSGEILPSDLSLPWLFQHRGKLPLSPARSGEQRLLDDDQIGQSKQGV